MFNIPAYFKIVFNNKNINWTTPKAVSESLAKTLYFYVDGIVNNTFYNQFYSGKNKGRNIYREIETELKEVALTDYISQMADKLRSINYKDNAFNSDKVTDEILDNIKNARNLTSSVSNGLIRSYRLNHIHNKYLFLAESLFYALKVQIVKNVAYEELEKLPQTKNLSSENQPAWAKLFDESKLEGQNFSARFIETLRFLTEQDVETFLKIMALTIYDEESSYHLYAPITDEEFALYEKFGIGNDEFSRLDDCGILKLGVRRKAELTVYSDDISGFQNDNLVLAIISEKGENLKLEYKTFHFTEVGSQILELIQPDTNDDFFTELAKIMKKNFRNEPVRTLLFEVEEMVDFEDFDSMDFGKDILKLN
jgi:hypothetical protein